MQRNTVKKIEIMKISEMLFQIRPLNEDPLSYYRHERNADLTRLTQQLKEYGLNVGVDYIFDPNKNVLEFNGKSHVVRALHAIPIDLFFFESHSLCKEQLQKYKDQFTLNLAPNNCFYTEIPHVKQTQSLIFNALLQDILKIHTKFQQTNSPVINQLNAELQSLTKREDILFENTNLMLLMNALFNASTVENANATVVTKSFSWFKTESLLLPMYNELIKKYSPLMPANFKIGIEMEKCKSNKPK